VRLRSRARGQSVVEFGILALLFALMMFAIVEFGLLLNGWVSVSSTTREAARWAATGLHVAGSGAIDGIYEKVAKGQKPAGVPWYDQTVTVEYGSPPTLWTCTTPVVQPPYAACTGPGGLTATPDTFPALTGPTAVPIGTPVKVTITAAHYEVITPLVRPFFDCNGTVVHCYVPISSWSSMYYEGTR
jgi:Flp pilus assembly protein TadG